VRSGAFRYDDANAIGQAVYTLVNLRGGYTARRWLADVFVRNAFGTEYIPLAFPYPDFAPPASWARWGRRARSAPASACVSEPATAGP
jgi:hypothetical protein